MRRNPWWPVGDPPRDERRAAASEADPMYLVNGKVDHLTPIGNIYLLLESGPATGRVARIYANDGHIAARNEREWGPASWRWLRQQLEG